MCKTESWNSHHSLRSASLPFSDGRVCFAPAHRGGVAAGSMIVDVVSGLVFRKLGARELRNEGATPVRKMGSAFCKIGSLLPNLQTSLGKASILQNKTRLL